MERRRADCEYSFLSSHQGLGLGSDTGDGQMSGLVATPQRRGSPID